MEASPFFQKLLQDESGVTAIEYGLLAGLIAVVIVGSVTALSSEIIAMFEYWSGKVLEAIG